MPVAASICPVAVKFASVELPDKLAEPAPLVIAPGGVKLVVYLASFVIFTLSKRMPGPAKPGRFSRYSSSAIDPHDERRSENAV